ncbi:hypothetical protein U9M48_039499 [Paspalum notatum var. saurae]|uniref:Uncharacterized protein n=1 Tax=Paspalum notatum var. saurae TaxID=547442 RepID=A0AAQ3UJ26_PASNO
MTGDKKDDGAPTIEDCVLLSDMNAFQENVKSWITEGAKKTNKTLSTITQTLVSLTDRMDAIEKRHPAPTEEGDVPAASHKKSTAKDDNDEEEDLDEEEEEGETEQQRRLRLRLQHNRFGMGGKKGGNKGNNFRDDDPFAKRRSCRDANLGAAGAVSAAAAPSHPGKRGQRLLPLSGNLHHHHHLRRHHVQQ